MVPENYKILYLHQVGLVLWIMVLNEFQNLELYEGLVKELLFAADDF